MQKKEYTFDDIMKFHPENPYVYEEIKRKASILVPFVGAGLTAFAYGSWNNILKQLSGFLISKKTKERFNELLRENDYLEAAEFLEKELGSYNFQHDLMHLFSRKKFIEKKEELQTQAIWLLPDMFQNLVITTNFDAVLEYVYQERGLEFETALRPGDDALLTTARRENTERVLFKLHGTITEKAVDYDRIVLTKSQYQKYYVENSDLQRNLMDCFKEKLLLFLGCSLQQDRTMELLQRVLVPGINNYTIFSCKKNERAEQKKRLGEMHIRSILYNERHHESVRIVLERLLEDLKTDQKSKGSCGIKSGTAEVHYPKKLTMPPALNPKVYKGSRSALEDKVLHHIEAGENVLLYGCGGIGKTSVAQEIYHTVSSLPIEKYGVSSLAWVTYIGDLSVSIYNSVPEHKGKDSSTSFAFEWLEENPNLLLFIDNVDEENAYKSDLLFRSLGNYPIRAVITGRIRDKTFWETEEVLPLPLEACRKLFYYYYENCVRQDDILDQILTTLCCHTVTVELTAKIAAVEGVSLEKLKRRLVENGLKFSEEAVGTITYSRLPDEKKLIEQLKIIFSISNCDDEEKRLLRQMAVIPQQPVTKKEIHEWFECKYHVIEAVVRKGWISMANAQGGMYSMNRIVSQAILEQNSMEEVYISCSKFAGILSNKLYVKEHRNDNTLEKYLTLGSSVLQICHEQMHSEKDMRLLVNFLNAYTYIGAYQEIIDLQDIAQGIYRRFAANSVLAANMECILGVACQRVAEFRRAIEHYNKALNICRQCSDYKASELYWAELILENNIASARHRCGNFQEADILYSELEDRCTIFLNEQKDRRVETLLADCMNNHGALLSEWGKQSSEQYCLSALKKNLTFLVDDKEDRTYINTNFYINLALCVADGNAEYIDHLIAENTEAKNSFALMELVLQQRKSTENKLALATAEHNLGVFYYLMKNDLETALKYTRDALNIRERSYGRTHPSTMSSRINLGTFLLLDERDSSQTQEGLNVYRDIVSDLGQISDEERSNIQQIPRIINSNMGLFSDKDIRQEVREAVSVYCKKDTGDGVVKQLHEAYGLGRCRSDVWNFIITREVSNITIANKF